MATSLLVPAEETSSLAPLPGTLLTRTLRLFRRPRIPAVSDCTLAMLADPYRFVGRTCAHLRSDVFQGRFLFRRTIFMMGEEAAELFSNPALCQRRGAAPQRLQRTLLGRGGVQTLDGEAHHRRKALFMTLVGPEQAQRLAGLAGRHLKSQAQAWGAEVDFYDEARRALTRAACAWAGVPLQEDELPERQRQLTALFDQVSLFGPWHWRARRSRHQAERWCMEILRQVRRQALTPPDTSALAVIARAQGNDNRPLPLHTAAVELLNVLRPVVAVSVYLVFVAMALEAHPEWRARLQKGNDRELEAFVHEVRRFYPFFPQVVARTRQAFTWKGFRFPKGQRLMLDLYATNHDPRLWENPGSFRPERFLRQAVGAYDFIPQGAGDRYVHHRCPGEGPTIELMKTVAKFLSRVSFAIDAEDREINWRRLPPLPRGQFMLRRLALQ